MFRVIVLGSLILSCVCQIYGQITTVSQPGCSYTFLVPKQEDNACPSGSVASGSNDVKIETLTSIIKNQQDQLYLLTQSVMELQEKNKGSTPDNGDGRIGTNYIRWGRTSCPDTATLIYEGYAGNSHTGNTGGGANYICLDKYPQWRETLSPGLHDGDRLHGVEYETLPGMDSDLKDNDAPCAVCLVEGRGQQLMIPGNRTCPHTWTKEYEGVLVSSQHTKQKSTFVCLDKDPEMVPGGGEDNGGASFNIVEVRCNTLPCPPFVDGNGVTCVVCTH